MSKINSFASDIKDYNVSYIDAARNSNGLDLLIIPFMIACAFYSHYSTVFGMNILLVIISCRNL